MRLSREEVIHIALLARLGLSESEIEVLREQLSNILEQFEVLQKVDTTDVPPFTHAVPRVNVIGADKSSPSMPQKDVLANAPQREEEFFRVKAILE